MFVEAHQFLIRRVAAIAAVMAAGALLLAAAPAGAHVSVNPEQATQGGYQKVSFRVPNERDAAATVKLEIVLDAATVIPNASIKPVPGWNATVTMRTLSSPVASEHGEYTESVDRIVWSAESGATIASGQFGEFDVSFGPLPMNSEVVFAALQTYDNGEIVRWIDTNPDAEHPAPTLTLAAADADEGHHHTGRDGRDAVAHADSAEGTTALSIVALVVGGLGLVAGVVACLLLRRALLHSKKATPVS